MKSAVETLNPTRVRLTVEVPFEELKDSLDAAYKKINQQVTVKGFRKGKIPARVIDQRFGRGAVLEEAVNDALPKFYTDAVNEAELNPLGQPEVDITELKDGETLNFTAEVDIRPSIEIPDYPASRSRSTPSRSPTRTSRSRWSSCASASPPPPRSSAPPRTATCSPSTCRPRSTARSSRTASPTVCPTPSAPASCWTASTRP